MEHAFRFAFPEDRLRAHQRPLVELFAGCHRVLDIGSGRGVMLDLLRERGIGCEGVDLLPEAVAHSQGKGHTVHLGEATDFLRDIHERYDGMMASHVVEHLEPAAAVRLLELCYQATQPGGVLVIVTPNPRDLEVMSDVFWLDTTHRRPYPPELLSAMMETAGFVGITTRTPWGRPARRREWPSWLLHKAVLGRYYGKPETIAVGRKPDQRVPA